jgi:uncharacterized protein
VKNQILKSKEIKLRILIDIGHPAHVHLFKNPARIMQEHGHRVQFTCRDREFVRELLHHEGFQAVSFGRRYQSGRGKIYGLFRFTSLMLSAALKFKPDVFLSHGSMYAAFAAFLLRKPHISMEDTANREQTRLYLPFTKVVLTSSCFPALYGKKQVYYNGYHELAYLHPGRFQAGKEVVSALGLSASEPYVIMRFVSWDASHDAGHSGISYENKLAAVKAFSQHAKVFISSEKPLPATLQQYRFPLPSWRMHHAMAFASLVYGESATMVSEAAMLGVPGIFLNNTELFYLQEQEKKYGLIFNFSESQKDQQLSIQKGIELLTTPGIREKWQQKRSNMLDEKIDVSAFLTWFIENWPESLRVMQGKSGFLEKFSERLS